MSGKKYIVFISILILMSIMLSTMIAFAITPRYATKVNDDHLVFPIDEKFSIKNGTIIFEAEDIIHPKGGSMIVTDDEASNGEALAMKSLTWYANLPFPDIESKIYIDDIQEEGIYKLWYRIRKMTTSESSGAFWDLNNGIWTRRYFSSVIDGKYRWSSTNIELHEGENYIKMQRMATCYLDKIIITSDLSFTPEGKDDVPVYRTPEEEHEYLYSLYDVPEIKPIEGHPRLYLTKDYIPTLKNTLETGNYNYVYERVKKYAYEDINCKLDTSISNNHNTMLLVKIMSRALMWVLGEEKDINYAKQTYRYMVDYLETVRTPDDEGDITRSRGNYLVAASVVYDWIYDTMTPEEKEYLLELIKKVVESKEIGWPPTAMSSLESHASEREIYRDLLAAGVAVYDEYPVLYDVAAGRMFEEMIPGKKWMYSSGRPLMGNAYGESRWSSEMWADMTFNRMGYDSIFGELSGEPYTWFLYSRLPYGAMMRKGDMYSVPNIRYDSYYVNYPEGIYLACQLYDNPYFKNEWDRLSQIYDMGEHEKFYLMLFERPSNETVDGKVKDDLSLTLKTKYPASSVIAKTSWQEGFDSDAAMVTLDMHEAFVSDHQEVYTGDFQFYYKGLLAMNTGVYNTSTLHNEGYNRRAIAANVMLCYDPNETFVPTWSNVIVPNDGGQRNPYVDENGLSKGAAVKTLDEFELDENGVAQNRDLIVADDVRTYAGPNEKTPEFSYISGDLTNAYSNKVKDYHRSMVFMNLFNDEYPAALIVFDKMSSADKSFKKTWLLHSQEEPQIKGTKTIITRTEGQFDGKLVNETLLPARGGFTTSVVGGKNNEMYNISGVDLSPKEVLESGNYRIEISPTTEKVDDVFLNAMFVTQNSANLPDVKMYKENGANFVGVTLMNRMVTFSEDATIINEPISLSVRNNGYDEVSVLLTDVEEGKWLVTSSNGTNFTVESKKSENVLYFKVSPGQYKITKADASEEIKVFGAVAQNFRRIGDFMIWRAAADSKKINDGNFLYCEKPTKDVNGIAYVGVEVLKQFGAMVRISGNSVEIIASNGGCAVTDGTAECIKDGKVETLKHIPFKENGTIYVALSDFEDITGYTFSYRVARDLVFAKKVQSE